jgi:hypothetical protein
MKKCIYCGCEIDSDSVIDFCERCGIGVWGKKMFDAIKDNMTRERENGNLCHQKRIDSSKIEETHSER